MKPNVLFLVFVAAVSASPAKSITKSYNGYTVVRAHPQDDSQVFLLADLQNKAQFDFWTEPRRNGPVDIMAAPEQLESLQKFLRTFGIPSEPFVEDVGRKWQDVQSLVTEPKGPKSSRYALTWDEYYSLEVIYEFVYSLAADYPNLVTIETIGQSYEGRDLIIAKVSSGGDGTKPALFVDAGFHAREWITPATLTFVLRELVENYAAHPELVDNVDWYFVPDVNPDGYEYTRSSDRLWRKTRGPAQGLCTGTDPNRNWDFHWSEPGASGSSCSETYYGDSAFSEVETAALRDQILKYAAQVKMYISLHSYSQVWLTPYGYTTDDAANYADQVAVADEAIAALTAVRGTVFTSGSSSTVLYINSGSSKDWAYGVAGIPYSYVVELPDTGRYGFLLPASEILPVGTETWEAFRVLATTVAAMKK